MTGCVRGALIERIPAFLQPAGKKGVDDAKARRWGGGSACRRGPYSAAGRCAVQRSAAESSADLASTQAAPLARSSFFQNGARILR
jgi:hypothetical protein